MACHYLAATPSGRWARHGSCLEGSHSTNQGSPVMKQPLLFIAALLIATTPLTAQEWVSFGTPDNVSAGQEFWDNASWDGASCNVGFVLSGVAGSANNPCSNQRPGSWLPYNGPTPTTFLSTNGGPTGFQFGAGNYTF